MGNRHKNLVKIGRAVPEIYSRTDRQRDRQTDKHRHAHHNTPMPLQRGGVIRTVVATDAKRRGDRCQRCDARQKGSGTAIHML